MQLLTACQLTTQLPTSNPQTMAALQATPHSFTALCMMSLSRERPCA